LNLLANRIRTPDGTILESRHRHDYRSHTDKTNGCTYAVDGGLTYLRRVWEQKDFIELSVYDTDKFEVIREVFTWGTRGKDGKQPVTYVALKDLTTEHIEAILETQYQIPYYIRDTFVKELEYRKSN
jgi:hypothetical protein